MSVFGYIPTTYCTLYTNKIYTFIYSLNVTKTTKKRMLLCQVHSLIHVHDYLPFIVIACSLHAAISQLIWMALLALKRHPGGAIITRPCSAKQKKLHFLESGPLNLGTDCWTSVPSTITTPRLLECTLCLLVGPLEVTMWDAAMSGLQLPRLSQE